MKIGETEKMNLKVFKSTGKLGGNSKNQIHFEGKEKWRETGGKLKISFFRPIKVQGNCRETGGKLKNMF